MLAGSLLGIEGLLRKKTAQVIASGVRDVLVLEYLIPLGCCVHMTPLFAALKQCRPEIKITVATRSLGFQVLRHSPDIDHLIETPDPLQDLGRAIVSLRRVLRELHVEPECVLTGASDQRTRIALLAVFAAAGWRGGYTLKRDLYHRPLEYDQSISLIRNNLRLAALLDCDAGQTEPRVFFSSYDVEVAQALLRETAAGSRPIVAMVTQNSGGQQTGWYTERFAMVVRYLSETLGCTVIYVGTSGEAAAIEMIRQATAAIGISFAGRTSVTELAALLAMSDAMITLDTGTMHVGRAVGTPMVVLAPSWQKPVEWLPLRVANARVLRGPDRDIVPTHYRLDEITAEGVMTAIKDILRLFPASEEARERRLKQSLSTIEHAATAR